MACAYCKADAVVDLAPYLKDKKVIVRREGSEEQDAGQEYQFPKILPTRKLD